MSLKTLLVILDSEICAIFICNIQKIKFKKKEIILMRGGLSK